MQSIWEKTGNIGGFAPPQGDFRTDVLIIGGGMCGLLCAYMLQQAGVDYALVEADRIGSGITKHTTAKITAQHGLIYDKLLHKYGAARAKQYWQANEAAVRQYAALCRDIDCDFERKDAYVYALNDRRKLTREMAALEVLGVQTQLCSTVPLPFSTVGAIRWQDQAQFNPVKFMAGIAPGLRIYEHTRVRELVGTTAVTNSGTVQAKKVIVATHFPFLNKHGWYFIKLYQHRSYVLALQNAPQVEGMYVDEAQEGMSFRNYGDLLLVGGGDHRTGKQGGGLKQLRAFAARYYPKARECAHWATQDCMSLDGVPYIGPYARSTQGLYVATGFNKWGMTSSMVAATLLTDLVQGKENPCRAVFAPSRSVWHGQLAVNAWEATVNLLTPGPKRCPHLGCALKWNAQEHTWDCPCHGSRFTEDGKLIDNPATGDLQE